MRRFACAAAFLLAACSDPLSSGRVQVRAADSYYGTIDNTKPVIVRYTVTNGSDETVALDACGTRIDAHPERKDGGSWTPDGGMACLAVVTPPIQVAPGATVTDSTEIVGWGTWRLRIRASAGGTAKDVVSQTFESGYPGG
jgi:hypothetical protein